VSLRDLIIIFSPSFFDHSNLRLFPFVPYDHHHFCTCTWGKLWGAVGKEYSEIFGCQAHGWFEEVGCQACVHLKKWVVRPMIILSR
jgi:hypothetical protein